MSDLPMWPFVARKSDRDPRQIQRRHDLARLLKLLRRGLPQSCIGELKEFSTVGLLFIERSGINAGVMLAGLSELRCQNLA